MKKIVRLTESDLTRLVKRVITENSKEDYHTKISKIEQNFKTKINLFKDDFLDKLEEMIDDIRNNQTFDSKDKNELLKKIDKLYIKINDAG
jgi:hypothetical protein